MILTTSSGTTLSIPVNLDLTRDAKDWNDVFRRPYVFSGPISGIQRKENAQVVKFQFWDTKKGIYKSEVNPSCQYRCCGLCDITIWPWSTLPLSRQGPLGEVITWRDLYKIELWESNWDEALLRKKRVEQHIGAAWHPPIIQEDHINIFMGAPVHMTQQGYIAVQGVPGSSFAPNMVRIALSYSALCGFSLLQRRREMFAQGKIALDSVASRVLDPEMRRLAVQAKIGCGCKLVDWEHENVGIKVIRLDDSEISRFDRFR
jgi:hypothetical protein